ncbi:MAG TPA: PIN domain-containing protein [Pyrinomonadaceae bacterium]|nr:PIN domain-containing protein [Pyrinomonadaceae bacterium]
MGAPPVMKLDDALKNVSPVAFDTAPIIYFVEANPTYDALVTTIFESIENGKIIGITSVISLCEVLVHPIRNQNQNLKSRYRDILQNSPNFFTKSINAAIAERAAELRAKYNLRTPDALQISTAPENGCDAFLCNDKNLKKVAEIKVLILDEITL